jgi:hypothetical protein
MRITILTVLVGLTAGCTSTTAYWDRPGASFPQLVSEAEGCYRDALSEPSPSALPGEASRAVRRSELPPALWKRPPRQAGLERFDEQLRYERCMHARGWVPSGSTSIRR